ncbi:xanthine dehydrogenase accessory protein XdhC [Actimicrobium antarcticum]|uniref:Xanthine dehydrogenase accessory protein XdhC n=1 Tax=Actimicrobium antarcticum TaxID=1051899 RepID=A0ABP7SMS8_9BURK
MSFFTDCPNGVLVTVAAVAGSAPRETGAKMLVTRDRQIATIGGGHLELRACEIAREMLVLPAARRLERFALGPSLGQCCGGVVHLAFERIDADQAGHVALLGQRWQERRDTWRVVALDAISAPSLLDDRGQCLDGPPTPVIDRALPTHILRDAAAQHWLVDRCLAYRSHLLLFGAGHVGAAIVRALADLPCHVTWIDQRDDVFPASVPANTTIEITDTPQSTVRAASPGSSFLVMTHSHALDQALCEAILQRNDAIWFGLIGSTTKRHQFEHRLRERGIPDQRLAGMTCPVGIDGISGKAPAVIAAAVAAQLLQVWEASLVPHAKEHQP